MSHNANVYPTPPALETRLAELLRRHGGGRGKGLLSLTVALPELAFGGLPHHLAEHSYWANPAEGLFLLGLGRAANVETQGEGRFRAMDAAFAEYCRHWEAVDADGAGTQPAALAGFAFDRDRRGESLPNARLTVPLLLLQQRDGICTATFSCGRDGAPDKVLAVWLDAWRRALAAFAGEIPSSSAGRSLDRVGIYPPDEAWLDLAQRAIEDIRAGVLDKLVLSRRVRLRGDRPFVPAAVMAALAARYPECFQFSHAEAGRGAFLGATPERLVSLRGGQAVSEALAGTAWGGVSAGDLDDDKTRREHRLVVNAIVHALEPACRLLQIPARPAVLELQDLRHLRSVVKGDVKPGTTLLSLVERLHPTPAMGGYPVRPAQQWLADHGEARPAWYSGATGWLGLDGDGDFAVALRCAWLAGNEAELSAGAGIVAGSDPETELAETEAKLNAMRKALENS
ncbi:MAG: isochorismate synthase [Sulfuricella sp.]|nr:isochorismate synthase [Sulfuricella sp.]